MQPNLTATIYLPCQKALEYADFNAQKVLEYADFNAQKGIPR